MSYVPNCIWSGAVTLTTAATSYYDLLPQAAKDIIDSTVKADDSFSINIAVADADIVHLTDPSDADPTISPRLGRYVLADADFNVHHLFNFMHSKGIAVGTNATLTLMLFA